MSSGTSTTPGVVPVEGTSPDELVAWMNTRHAVVVEAGKTVVITIGYDEILDRPLISRSTFTDIKNLYLNRVVVTGQARMGSPREKNWGTSGCRTPIDASTTASCSPRAVRCPATSTSGGSFPWSRDPVAGTACRRTSSSRSAEVTSRSIGGYSPGWRLPSSTPVGQVK